MVSQYKYKQDNNDMLFFLQIFIQHSIALDKAWNVQPQQIMPSTISYPYNHTVRDC